MNKESSKKVSLLYIIASTILVLAFWLNNYKGSSDQPILTKKATQKSSQTDSLQKEEFWQEAQFMKD